MSESTIPEFRYDSINLRVRVDDVEHQTRRAVPVGAPLYRGRAEDLCHEVDRAAAEMKAHLRKQPAPGEPEPLVSADTWERALRGDLGGDPRSPVSNHLYSLYRRAETAGGAGEVDRLRAVCIELQRQINAHMEREIARAHLTPFRAVLGPIPPDSPPKPRKP